MLEQVIAENTAVMKELVELLRSGAAVPPPSIEEPKKAKKAAKPLGEAPPPSTKDEAPAAPAVEYKQVADAITILVARNRARAVEILEGFGVKKGPELKPEQYADALSQLQAALQ